MEQKYLNRHQANLKLLRIRFRIRRKALYYAAREDSAENLKCSLKSIDDNNDLKTMLGLQDYRDLTVFHYAAYLSAEHLEVILSCIEERQWDCFSLLSTACLSRPVLHVVENVETLHLIRCKLSPAQWIKLLKEVDDQSGHTTCLHSFFWKGNLECVKYILNTLDVEASMVLLSVVVDTDYKPMDTIAIPTESKLTKAHVKLRSTLELVSNMIGSEKNFLLIESLFSRTIECLGNPESSDQGGR